eukprot:TRINITY_DN4797_c0_g1_i1.p1 TRINITY_DN4797_c0_g1~~TRINITY_DN4797_c0_g1_i1.p1  ORF type:complete len:367 (-),score=42.77 TRINITY_DN4797_c0_g1_i1:95-1195(-)
MRSFILFCVSFVSFLHTTWGLNCIQNPAMMNSTNPFVELWNLCMADPFETNIWSSIGFQLQQWFSTDTYPLYIVTILFFMPFTFWRNSNDSDYVSRGNSIRLHLLFLLMRIGLVMSTIPWLWAAVREARPCLCYDAVSNKYIIPNQDSQWGMPSGQVAMSTLIGLHLAQFVSVPAGLVFTVGMIPVGLPTADHSLGQIIVGFVFGIIVHVYSTRTPLLLRFFDMIAALIAGLVCFFVVKDQNKYDDFSFSTTFLEGIAWQLYTMIILAVIFDTEFIRLILKKSFVAVHIVDFLYYQPVQDPDNSIKLFSSSKGLSTSQGPSSSEGPYLQFPSEFKWLTFYTIILLIILCGLRIMTPYLDGALALNL